MISGTAQDLGNGNFVVSNTIENYAIVNNLQANTTYHFALFEYNGFNQPLYLAPAAVYTITTSTVLPVKLAAWEATPLPGKVQLEWTTATETNTSHFVIERSVDGNIFTPVAEIPANHNSQAAIQYSKEDTDPLPGKSYYRLKMVDLDGKFEYSVIRVVLLNTKQTCHHNW
ncbi:MAG: hypothetical protein WDO19_01995 [Bacteroidota bacterium]